MSRCMHVEWRLAQEDDPEAGEGDCVIPIDEFRKAVACGAFTDDDGYGDLASNDHFALDNRVYVSDIGIDLSNMSPEVLPSWVTHVCWYNSPAYGADRSAR